MYSTSEKSVNMIEDDIKYLIHTINKKKRRFSDGENHT